MAIDDNTQYSLSGAQVKDLAARIKDANFKVLTTSDYNWNSTTGDQTEPYNCVALWLLPTGTYKVNGDSVAILFSGTTGTQQTSGDTLAIIDKKPNAGTQADTLMYIMTHRFGGGALRPLVIYAYYNSGIQRWRFNNTDRGSTAYTSDVLIGKDIVDNLTTTDGAGGSRNGKYAALSAYQGYLLNQKIEGRVIQNAGAPTTATVGTVGMLLEDTTNGKLYICTAITPGTDPDPDTYTWEEVGAGGPTVVQTTGTSTTDVMSQNATTSMIFADPSAATRIRIGSGSNAGTDSVGIGKNASGFMTGCVAVGRNADAHNQYTMAIGAQSSATNQGAIAFGAYSSASHDGEMNIGSSNTVYGYNNTNYRLLSGVHDPVSAHDAATKGYVDSVAPVITMTSTDPGEGAALAANNFIAVYNAS